MMPDNFRYAVMVLAKGMDGAPVQWAIVSGTSIALQGVDVTPGDIDVATSKEGLEYFTARFPLSMQGPPVPRRPRPGPEHLNLPLMMFQAPIEVFGEDDDDIFYSRIKAGRIVPVDVDGVSVPCLSLEANLEVLRIREKHDKAALLEDYLKKR